MHSLKYLDVRDGQTANGTNVWQCNFNGSAAQQWIIKAVGNGYYNIISRCSEAYLTARNNSGANGTNIEICTYTGGAGQKFKFNEVKQLKGVDVSSHQGNIDWQKVKNAGIDYAIIRCGFGMDQTDQDDSKFLRNVKECERLNIPYGVYIYSYALNTNAAISEANHVLRLVKGHSPQMGIWFDMEDADGYKQRKGMPSNANLVNICKTFCDKIKANGYRCRNICKFILV